MATKDKAQTPDPTTKGPFVMLVNADGTPFTGYARNGGGIGGHLLGQVCHNHVLAEVYADFDGEGHLVGMHTHDVGSC